MNLDGKMISIEGVNELITEAYKHEFTVVMIPKADEVIAKRLLPDIVKKKIEIIGYDHIHDLIKDILEEERDNDEYPEKEMV